MAGLDRTIKVCDEAFLSRQGSTDDAWTELAATRGQLLGRLARLRARSISELDDDGNPPPPPAAAVAAAHPQVHRQPRDVSGAP